MCKFFEGLIEREDAPGSRASPLPTTAGFAAGVNDRSPGSDCPAEGAESHVEDCIQGRVVDKRWEQEVGERFDHLPCASPDDADDGARDECPATGNRKSSTMLTNNVARAKRDSFFSRQPSSARDLRPEFKASHRRPRPSLLPATACCSLAEKPAAAGRQRGYRSTFLVVACSGYLL